MKDHFPDRTRDRDRAEPLDLRRAAAEAVEAARTQGKPAEPTLVPREIVWPVRYVDPDGELHEDTVTSRIMSGDERLAVGYMIRSLAQGAWEGLPDFARARIAALAHVTLQTRELPKWVERWMGEDETLLFALAGKCQEHEALFFGADDRAGPQGPREPRLRIGPTVPAAPAGK